VDFDLFDIRNLEGFDPSSYTFVGFASYTDYYAPPRSMIDTISKIPLGNGRESFVLMTYAGMIGKAVKGLKEEVEQRGYKVITSHFVAMPESYPPMRKKGIKKEDNPKDPELERFQQFIRELGDLIVTKELKGKVDQKKNKIGLFNTFVPYKIRTDKLKGMGKKKVDLDLCTRCSICMKNCPYNAISMNDGPIFDEKTCHACFGCYNKCPVGAITSEKVKTSDHKYPGPSERLKKKMSY